VFDQFDSYQAKPPESGMDYAEGLARSAAQGATFGFGDELAAGMGSLFGLGPMIGGKSYDEILSEVRGQDKAFRERHPVTSTAAEIAGGIVAPLGAAKAIKAAPTFLQGAKQSAKIGAGAGAAAGFGHGEGGVGDRVEGATTGALVGGTLAPALTHAALPVASRLAGATRDAFNYGGRAIQGVRNPQQAAIDSVADRMVAEGIDPAALRAEIAPKMSSNLVGRNFTEDQLADIVSRGLKGEPTADIGKAYGLHKDTVKSYLDKFREANPTDRNIIDVSKDLVGDGKAAPLSRLGRAAYSLADDGEAAQRLITRQQTQAGRVSNIVDRAGGGRNFDDEIARIDDELGKQSKAAYAQAEANAQPFNLKPVIGKYRRAAFGRAGEIREQMEKAIDGFFEPVMGPKGTVRRLGQPISDMKRFQAARQDLDQMIAKSYHDNKATPLTKQLTKLRQELTGVVRAANKDLALADDLFSGAKSSEKLLEQGSKLTTRLGAPSRQIMEGFEKLKPEQQEMVRLGFLRKLQDMAANTRDGAAVANQFNSPAVRQTIERLFSGDKKMQERGLQLIKNLRQEATTTRTKNDLLSGSRTAELGGDMEKLSQGAQTAADLATGQVWKVLSNLSTRLTSQIGERGSKEVLDILTQTDPAQLLPMLNKLAASAKTAAQRQAYVTTIRQLKAQASPSIGVVSGQQAAGRD
jgi:hypothetical protein